MNFCACEAGAGECYKNETPRRHAAERLVLVEHQPIVVDLLLLAGEVAVPEERHFFFQGTGRVEHPIGPPQRDAIPFPVAGEVLRVEGVNDFLVATIALLSRFAAVDLTLLVGLAQRLSEL